MPKTDNAVEVRRAGTQQEINDVFMALHLATEAERRSFGGPPKDDPTSFPVTDTYYFPVSGKSAPLLSK